MLGVATSATLQRAVASRAVAAGLNFDRTAKRCEEGY